MILKLDQWIANAIGKEARISHCDVKVYGGTAKTVTSRVRSEIEAEYSEKFLGDADYMLFFKGPAVQDEESLKNLASVVQRALGKSSANDLAVSDFKLINADERTGDEDSGEEAEASHEAVKYAFVKVTIA